MKFTNIYPAGMILPLIFAASLALGAAPAAHGKADTGAAANRNLGVGLSLFGPTGLSLKYMLHSEAALDAAAGWSSNDIDLHADYLLQRNHLAIERGWSLNLHYGVGGRILIGRGGDQRDNDKKPANRLGVRLPLGLDVTMGKLNVELFGEVALIVDFVNETNASLDIAMGVRLYL